jgi:hypothetical protein
MRIQYVPAQKEEQVTLQGILKRWVMNVCTGFIWLMIRETGFANMVKKLHLQPGDEIFQNNTDSSGLQSNKGLLVLYLKHHHALIKIQ